MHRPTRPPFHVLSLAVFVAFLTGCGPSPQPFNNGTTKSAGPFSVALELQPNLPTPRSDTVITATLRQGAQPVQQDAATVEVLLDMPNMQMNPPPVAMNALDAGRWRATTRFPMAGGWSATVRVTPRGAPPVEATFAFDVGP